MMEQIEGFLTLKATCSYFQVLIELSTIITGLGTGKLLHQSRAKPRYLTECGPVIAEQTYIQHICHISCVKHAAETPEFMENSLCSQTLRKPCLLEMTFIDNEFAVWIKLRSHLFD